jgi:hypothetical protein
MSIINYSHRQKKNTNIRDNNMSGKRGAHTHTYTHTSTKRIWKKKKRYYKCSTMNSTDKQIYIFLFRKVKSPIKQNPNTGSQQKNKNEKNETIESTK